MATLTNIKTSVKSIRKRGLQKRLNQPRRMSQTMTAVYDNGDSLETFFFNFTNTQNIQTKADLLGCFFRKDERLSPFVQWIIERDMDEEDLLKLVRFMFFHIEYYNYDFVLLNEWFGQLLEYVDRKGFKEIQQLKQQYIATRQKIEVWNGFFTNFINALMKKHTVLQKVYTYRDYHIIFDFVNNTCMPYINAIFHNEIDILNTSHDVVVQNDYFVPFDEEITKRLRKLFKFFGYYFFALFQIELVSNAEFEHMKTVHKLNYFFSLQLKMVNAMNDINKYLCQINEYIQTLHKLVDYVHYEQKLTNIQF
jgi:hypothetical protein